MPFEKQCSYCGKHFIAERQSRKYCSRECGWNAKQKHPRLTTCPTCMIEFAPYKNGRGGKFCSQECYHNWQKGKPNLVARKKRPKFTCEVCGQLFTVSPSTIKYRDPRFCSTDCFYKWLKGSKRAPRIKTKCLTCGKEMSILKSRYDANRGRYCSQECMIKDRPPSKPRKDRIKCACLQCGKIFYKLPCQMTKGRGQFCSRSCNASYHIRKASLNSPTSIEQALIEELEARNLSYEFQYQFDSWILDFAFPVHKLAIEADGIYWHSLPNIVEKDARKDADLQSQGWTVLRFTGDEIRESPQRCVDEIVKVLKQKRPRRPCRVS